MFILALFATSVSEHVVSHHYEVGASRSRCVLLPATFLVGSAMPTWGAQDYSGPENTNKHRNRRHLGIRQGSVEEESDSVPLYNVWKVLNDFWHETSEKVEPHPYLRFTHNAEEATQDAADDRQNHRGSVIVRFASVTKYNIQPRDQKASDQQIGNSVAVHVHIGRPRPPAIWTKCSM